MRGCENMFLFLAQVSAQASTLLAAFSVVGASFVVLKLSLQALTFLLDLASEPLESQALRSRAIAPN